MKNRIIELAKANCADIVGFAPASRFASDDAVFKIMPETKTVIGLAFRVLRGTYRGIEEGSTYYQYTTMAVENMEETIMPMASLKVAMLLEEEGYTALPQRRHQQIMAEENSTNPEVAYDAVYRAKTAETQMDFVNAAVACGLGERGLDGALLCDEFGPMIRYCFVLTDAEIEPDELVPAHLCDKCGKCIKACPGKAIDENGNVDAWQCAVYYNGANGGEAKVTPETARKILDHIYFYPPAQHAYQCSICGRACDVACYVHLEEKGLLTKKFAAPFRKREEWHFDIKDFE